MSGSDYTMELQYETKTRYKKVIAWNFSHIIYFGHVPLCCYPNLIATILSKK